MTDMINSQSKSFDYTTWHSFKKKEIVINYSIITVINYINLENPMKSLKKIKMMHNVVNCIV